VQPTPPPAQPTTQPAPQPTPAPKTQPEPPRWRTADGKLSLVLPQGWTVTGKGPYDILQPGLSLRLLPPDSYRSEKELSAILEQFAVDQKIISQRNFTRQPFTIDGSTGVQVRYLNMSGDTMLVYLFGKSGRLWQLEVALTGGGVPTPAAVTDLVNSLRVE
jgi:hypothetical protein